MLLKKLLNQYLSDVIWTLVSLSNITKIMNMW